MNATKVDFQRVPFASKLAVSLQEITYNISACLLSDPVPLYFCTVIYMSSYK